MSGFLWILQGGIRLKVWDWVHWDLGSFLCSNSVRHRYIFMCILGRAGSIQECSVVNQLTCSAALFNLPFRIYISKKELKNMIILLNLLKFWMSLFWHQTPGLGVWVCGHSVPKKDVFAPYSMQRWLHLPEGNLFSHVPTAWEEELSYRISF